MAPPEMPVTPHRAIIVFGSINVDLVCRAPKIPAPGETILAPSYDFFAGGKGANQAVAAARAGAAVRMVGAVGKDAFAKIPRDALGEAGVVTDFIHIVDAPTGAAFITVAPDGENAITVASGANRLAAAAMVSEAAWAGAGYILLQGELDWGEASAVAAWAKSRDVAVILNAAPSHDFPSNILRHVDKLVVNEHELAEIAESLGMSSDDFARHASSIARSMDCMVIVTRGKNGVACFGRDYQLEIPAHPVSVVDTTGAGDTFCGVFAAMLAEGCDAPLALARANMAAALACTKAGAQSAMPRWQEIMDALDSA